MQKPSSDDSTYTTPPTPVPFFSRLFPSLGFYPRFLRIVLDSAGKAKRGEYVREVWQQSSVDVLRSLERVGVELEVSGLGHARQEDGPVLFIGNHLSVMETVVLPAHLLPYRQMTYVIKKSLLELPVFKHVMASCEPIAVTRTNPRQDLKIVIEEGCERLSRGISIIVFPQTTRTAFDPEQFSTIGIKLAKRADVPIVPLALKTDAWGNGRWLKDFGKIDPARKARIAFGAPMRVEGKGQREHQAVVDFIERHLAAWS